MLDSLLFPSWGSSLTFPHWGVSLLVFILWVFPPFHNPNLDSHAGFPEVLFHAGRLYPLGVLTDDIPEVHFPQWAFPAGNSLLDYPGWLYSPGVPQTDIPLLGSLTGFSSLGFLAWLIPISKKYYNQYFLEVLGYTTSSAMGITLSHLQFSFICDVCGIQINILSAKYN